EFSPGDGNRGNGRPVAVVFKDGELIVGYTHSYNPERQGFFMLPADIDDNNLRIFVLKSAAKTLKLGPAAEEFARTAQGPSPSPEISAALIAALPPPPAAAASPRCSSARAASPSRFAAARRGPKSATSFALSAAIPAFASSARSSIAWSSSSTNFAVFE